MRTIYILRENEASITTIFSKAYSLGAEDFSLSNESDDVIKAEINDQGRKYDSKVFVTLEENGTMAYLSMYPPIGSGKPLTYEAILESIKHEGVRDNFINIDAVKKAFQMHEKDFVVEKMHFATGMKATQGRDASIILQFNTLDKKPKLNESGKVDYKNIDNIIHAKKGDVLITKRPATQGIRGLSVKNGEIVPTPGKDVEIYYSDGVMLNPAGTTYTATHDGYVEFNGTTISVHEIYYVNRNVDYTTGNIKFNGTVHVKGDVLSGFKVEAKKDVIIEGVCGDCEIVANKSITIKRGIKASDQNLFRAGEDITVGYCENGRIFAKNDIIIKKYAYNSELYAGNKIDATSGDGIIAGGIVKAFSEIQAKQLGTQGNSRFTVYIGTKYYIDMQLEKLRKEKAKLVDMLGQMNDTLGKFNLSRPDVINNPKIKSLQDIKRNFEKTISDMGEQEDELVTQSRADKPKIKVKGMVNSGITVMFFNSSSTVRENIENVVFYLDEKYGEVAWVSLKDVKHFEM